MSYRILLLLPFLALLAGCVNNPSKKTSLATAETPPTLKTQIQETLEAFEAPEPQEITAPPENQNLWQHLTRGYQLQGIRHKNIDRELQAFVARGASLTRQLRKGEPFLYHILQEVRERDMPTELALLPGVESGFRPTAYSRNGAAGLWQFMPATGRYFGLKQDWWYDARRDTFASTNAALDYLQKLHKRFDGDWLLAIASYNAGGGTVSRAIRRNQDKGKPTDFWSLDLPAETRQYVPRLLALARIIEHPGRYGVVLPEIEHDLRFVKVDIGEQIDLKVAARLAEMTTDELLLFNAGFNRWATHPHGPHYLLLPADKAESFASKLARLPNDQRLRWTRYHIQPGDNLGKIARQHGISVQELMQANHLKNHRIRAGAHLMIPLSSSTTIAAINTTAANAIKVRYKVKRGDSLYAIAKQFGVKVVDLKKWNQLASDRLRPGQKLTVVRTM
ncbi:LysM peptidoglycan-binding domain-containing protein [Thiolapillus sp.]